MSKPNTYTATIGGSSWHTGPVAEFPTIRACRAWAEEYGTTADYCTITDAKGREVASHRRDPNAPGGWYRAQV
jgi:hypothetical protein